MSIKILVAEDEEITLTNIAETLREEGYIVTTASDGLTASELLQKEPFQILITDIKMPRMNGMELLEAVKEHSPETDVLVITGYGSVNSAVEAMRRGAYDYITKPFDLDDLTLRVKKIEERRLLKKENVALKTYYSFDKKLDVVAKSDGMRAIVSTIDNIKHSDFNLLLLGETGVGKNLVAKIIHSASKRAEKPFLTINCATLTEELLTSELFGHERGAFTGAMMAKQGLVEIADTGILFLDEIAEMSPVLQAKLLRVLEEGEFYRVGATKPRKIDVRFLSATNQNIKKLISDGRFREDLYYRMNTMEIFIPPLRDRREDIKPLGKFLLQKHLPKYNKKITGFSDEALDILMHYSFPGNVRELDNIIERAIILENSAVITPQSLPSGITLLQVETHMPDKVLTVDEVVKEYAHKVVKSLGGNRTKAAEVLGISRTSLWKIMKDE